MTRLFEIRSSSASPSITLRLAVAMIAACIAAGVELSIGLCTRTSHGRTLAAVEHAKLNPAGIGGAAHQAIERIDLADQMTLAESTDRRIAGHRSDSGKAMGHQGGTGTHPRRRARGLAAGVATADDDNVE